MNPPPIATSARRPLPAPLWAVLMLPFGLAGGFVTIAVPFLLRGRGVDMTAIGTVSGVAMLPHALKVLWAPALDSGPRRRSWFLGSVLLTTLALAVAATAPPELGERVGPLPSLWAYTATLFVAQLGAATSGSAVLALMAVTVPIDRRGAASAWLTAGNLVGTSTGGALVVWMFSHFSPAATAVGLGALSLACALPVFAAHEQAPPRRSALVLVTVLLREIWAILKTREGYSGLLICLSPVGAGALTNLFSALAKEYAPDQASAERLVVVAAGSLGGVVNVAGSLAGGYLVDRFDRRASYIAFGGMTALCACAMAVFPATPASFTAGCLAYQFTNGLAYAAFYAFVLDLVGSHEGVTTQLALYAGAANLAATYVQWLDGWSYDRLKAILPTKEWAGRGGMLGMDALATFVGIAALWAVMARRPREALPGTTSNAA